MEDFMMVLRFFSSFKWSKNTDLSPCSIHLLFLATFHWQHFFFIIFFCHLQFYWWFQWNRYYNKKKKKTKQEKNCLNFAYSASAQRYVNERHLYSMALSMASLLTYQIFCPVVMLRLVCPFHLTLSAMRSHPQRLAVFLMRPAKIPYGCTKWICMWCALRAFQTLHVKCNVNSCESVHENSYMMIKHFELEFGVIEKWKPISICSS